jgi:hypothetical protein
MMIKMNLKGNFKTVPEGERVLTITKAEATPSGKPDKLKVTFQDSEGGFINSQYKFDISGALYQMSMLVSTALGLEDGDEFDTKNDTPKLVGKKVLCEVIHVEGTRPNEDGELPVFANIKRILKLVKEESDSPRNSIASNDDDDLD